MGNGCSHDNVVRIAKEDQSSKYRPAASCPSESSNETKLHHKRPGPPIFNLSSALFWAVLGNHLSACDVAARFAPVCKLFQEISRQEQLWRRICIVSFPFRVHALPSWLAEVKLQLLPTRPSSNMFN